MAVGELLGKVDEMLGGNPRWTSIPSRRSSNTLRETGILKLWRVGHMTRLETLPFLGKLETSQCFNL